ncbi:hypothetical protein INS49_002922 [Diaporthe citri]|uniref:uncharacterized protein n=1 Tax=Diaporthe citri TaxID=83186 RepID=UPI001C7F973F|nr:uncharacterized protein INS49_002922 [Diaporthe citri]KAG6368709.1 hypothetical protein INS49_002922 [Diaporthe citri]
MAAIRSYTPVSYNTLPTLKAAHKTFTDQSAREVERTSTPWHVKNLGDNASVMQGRVFPRSFRLSADSDGPKFRPYEFRYVLDGEEPLANPNDPESEAFAEKLVGILKKHSLENLGHKRLDTRATPAKSVANAATIAIAIAITLAVASAFTTALIDIFAEQVSLTPDRKKSLIGYICFCDSVDEDGTSGIWSPKNDYVGSGRLGRNHTLSDVPNHFIRDWLLEQIDDEEDEENEVAALNEDQRQPARRALFPDLTADQVSEYSKALAKKREDDLRAYRAKKGIPEDDATPEQIHKCNLKRIMLSYGFEHERQAEAVLKLHEAVTTVDTTIDLAPRVRPGAIRNYEKFPPLRRSVLFPGKSTVRLRAEAELPPPVQIDWDCDQIRLMIRRFCLWEQALPLLYYNGDGEFELDDFQTALGITRQTLTAFLKKKGPANGDKSQAYELAWEFFKRRDLLGYPLVKGEVMKSRFDKEASSVDSDDGGDDEATKEADVLHDNDSDRRPSKRQNEEADPGEDRSKRTKTTTMPRRRSERLKR